MMSTAFLFSWRNALCHRLLSPPLIVAALLLVSGCTKHVAEPASPGTMTSASASQQATGENPFSVMIMRQAYANLTASSVPEATAAVESTHLYLRFKPANTDQLAYLGNLGYRLSWVPMDESVAATTVVNRDTDEIPWIYTVVPVGTALPAAIPYEQIQELFLFTTEDGDTQDADPWQPDPVPPADPCGPQWDPSCQRYVTNVQCQPSSLTVSLAKHKPAKPGRQAEATKKLKKAKVSPRALYNEAMRLSRNPEEVLPDNDPALSLFGWGGTRYHPHGRLTVQDTDLGPLPLKGVKVESRRWFNFDDTYTDANGNFSISSGCLSLVKISVEFKNNLATTRGLISGLKVWECVLPINAELGAYEKGSMENIAYTITYQRGSDKWQSQGASTWAAATLFNALADAQNYAELHGLPGPARGINVWLFPTLLPKGSRDGSTPMLRTIASTSVVSRAIDFLLGVTGRPDLLLAKQVLQRQLPDMTIYYANKTQGPYDSPGLNALLFHELGHTQHYQQVGNNFWSVYIGHIVLHNGYGDKSDSGSGRIAISEGWGEYIQRLFTQDRYRGTTASSYAVDALRELEYQVPTDIKHDGVNDGWFVQGMYYDMIDNTVEPATTNVTDNVTAYYPTLIFRGLQPDVLTVRDYQVRVNAQNNGLQAPELEQLVTTYRW